MTVAVVVIIVKQITFGYNVPHKVVGNRISEQVIPDEATNQIIFHKALCFAVLVHSQALLLLFCIDSNREGAHVSLTCWLLYTMVICPPRCE